MKKSGSVIFTIFASSQLFAAPSEWSPVAAIGVGITSTINLGKSVTYPIIDPAQDEFYHYFKCD